MSRGDLKSSVHFAGFDDLCEKMLGLKGQLLCKEFENAVGEKYEKNNICVF